MFSLVQISSFLENQVFQLSDQKFINYQINFDYLKNLKRKKAYICVTVSEPSHGLMMNKEAYCMNKKIQKGSHIIVFDGKFFCAPAANALADNRYCNKQYSNNNGRLLPPHSCSTDKINIHSLLIFFSKKQTFFIIFFFSSTKTYPLLFLDFWYELLILFNKFSQLTCMFGLQSFQFPTFVKFHLSS